MALGRWLEGGFVLNQVYAANGGGINFTNQQGKKYHINNKGQMVAR